MSQSDTTTLTGGWTELTDANITRITLQNQGSMLLKVQGTTGTAPTSDVGSILVPPGSMLINEYLADLFPGVPAANRVFASGHGAVFFSHA